jgi:glycogen phosphorylase
MNMKIVGGTKSRKAANGGSGAVTVTLDQLDALRQQYGCGPVQFYGGEGALYDRHLFFDNVIDPHEGDARARFEAFSRAIRDILSQRWVKTERTYQRENPKRTTICRWSF